MNGEHMWKKLLLILILLAIAGGAAWAVLGGWTPIFQSDRHIIIKQAKRFMECIKFKEFGEAAAYHTAQDSKKADIPFLIERLFKVKPEQMDIQECNVIFGEIDSSGILGKTKSRCIVHLLNTKEVRKPEIVLYWKKEGGRWFLKLKSSLELDPRKR